MLKNDSPSKDSTCLSVSWSRGVAHAANIDYLISHHAPQKKVQSGLNVITAWCSWQWQIAHLGTIRLKMLQLQEPLCCVSGPGTTEVCGHLWNPQNQIADLLLLLISPAVRALACSTKTRNHNWSHKSRLSTSNFFFSKMQFMVKAMATECLHRALIHLKPNWKQLFSGTQNNIVEVTYVAMHSSRDCQFTPRQEGLIFWLAFGRGSTLLSLE